MYVGMVSKWLESESLCSGPDYRAGPCMKLSVLGTVRWPATVPYVYIYTLMYVYVYLSVHSSETVNPNITAKLSKDAYFGPGAMASETFKNPTPSEPKTLNTSTLHSEAKYTHNMIHLATILLLAKQT